MSQLCIKPENLCISRFKSKTSILWQIENFSERVKFGFCMRSSIFSSPSDPNTKWWLHLVNSEAMNVDIYLCLYVSDHKQMYTYFNLSLIDCNNRSYANTATTVCFSRNNHESEPLKHDLKEDIDRKLPNDVLTIYCQISYFEEKDGEVVELIEKDEKLNDYMKAFHIINDCTRIKSLSDDMSSLFENRDKDGDVVIVVNGHKLMAHKLILKARSQVFAAMFEHQMKECVENKIEINDIDKEVFEKLLRFLYTDEVVNEDMDSNMKLLSAADKYNLQNLISICEKNITSQLNEETAAQVLILADRHSAQVLETKAIDFIKRNLIKVIKTKGWKELIDRPDLLQLF